MSSGHTGPHKAVCELARGTVWHQVCMCVLCYLLGPYMTVCKLCRGCVTCVTQTVSLCFCAVVLPGPQPSQLCFNRIRPCWGVKGFEAREVLVPSLENPKTRGGLCQVLTDQQLEWLPFSG